MKMRWNVYWLPDTDAGKNGRGWISVDIMYPSPDYRGAPMVLLAAKVKAFRKMPAKVLENPFVVKAKRQLLVEIYSGLSALEDF